MTTSDIQTLNAMSQYGGSFVKALACAALHADSENLERIKKAFPELWDTYRQFPRPKSDSTPEPTP